MVLHRLALIAMALHAGVAFADGCGDPAAVKNDDGKYFDKNSNPTFNIAPDGTVDWYTYSGYRRYHSECHVCHGPDGMGSTYAPALKEALKAMTKARDTGLDCKTAMAYWRDVAKAGG